MRSPPLTGQELLRHLIGVYRDELEAEWCNQARDFHRAVAADAGRVLDGESGRQGLASAISEVCHELVICCMSDRRKLGQRMCLPQRTAKHNAAALIGIEYDAFKKLYNGVIPKSLELRTHREWGAPLKKENAHQLG